MLSLAEDISKNCANNGGSLARSYKDCITNEYDRIWIKEIYKVGSRCRFKHYCFSHITIVVVEN